MMIFFFLIVLVVFCLFAVVVFPIKIQLQLAAWFDLFVCLLIGLFLL